MIREPARDQAAVSVPQELHIIERSTVRVIVLDADGRILLFHTRDSRRPEAGTWWEPPGGGIDPGESYVEAALRELREEAGIRAEPGQVGSPSWTRRASFRYRENRYVNDEVVVQVRLNTSGPGVDGAQRLSYEAEDYFDFRWWRVSDVVRSDERFYPGRLRYCSDPFSRATRSTSRSSCGPGTV